MTPCSAERRPSTWAVPSRTKASNRCWMRSIRFLPSPLDREIKGRDPKDEDKKIELQARSQGSLRRHGFQDR